MKLKDLISQSVNEKPASRWPTFDGEELDRSQFVTASEAGKCIRQIWFGKYAAKNSLPPKGETSGWGFFERGHNVEAWFVETLRRTLPDHVDLLYAGDEQVSFYFGDQSSTPDGLFVHKHPVTGDDERYEVLEVKSMDPRTNKRNLPKPDHVKQTIQNMYLIGLCHDIEVKSGIITYVNASDYSDIVEFVIDYDQDVVLDLLDRATRVKAAEKADDLKPEGMFNGGCKWCTFTEHCSGAVEAAKKLKATNEKQKGTAKDVFG